MLMLLKRMERTDLTAHGFRSTFRDWAAECTNYPREVAEAALAHTLGDKVEAAYRRGDLFENRCLRETLPARREARRSLADDEAEEGLRIFEIGRGAAWFWRYFTRFSHFLKFFSGRYLTHMLHGNRRSDRQRL
jgi:hypothetical protein